MKPRMPTSRKTAPTSSATFWIGDRSAITPPESSLRSFGSVPPGATTPLNPLRFSAPRSAGAADARGARRRDADRRRRLSLSGDGVELDEVRVAPPRPPRQPDPHLARSSAERAEPAGGAGDAADPPG